MYRGQSLNPYHVQEYQGTQKNKLEQCHAPGPVLRPPRDPGDEAVAGDLDVSSDEYGLWPMEQTLEMGLAGRRQRGSFQGRPVAIGALVLMVALVGYATMPLLTLEGLSRGIKTMTR